jgi:hypothetical protein
LGNGNNIMSHRLERVASKPVARVRAIRDEIRARVQELADREEFH